MNSSNWHEAKLTSLISTTSWIYVDTPLNLGIPDGGTYEITADWAREGYEPIWLMWTLNGRPIWTNELEEGRLKKAVLPHGPTFRSPSAPDNTPRKLPVIVTLDDNSVITLAWHADYGTIYLDTASIRATRKEIR